MYVILVGRVQPCDCRFGIGHQVFLFGYLVMVSTLAVMISDGYVMTLDESSFRCFRFLRKTCLDGVCNVISSVRNVT